VDTLAGAQAAHAHAALLRGVSSNGAFVMYCSAQSPLTERFCAANTETQNTMKFIAA
jgi:hypothetical protein